MSVFKVCAGMCERARGHVCVCVCTATSARIRLWVNTEVLELTFGPNLCCAAVEFGESSQANRPHPWGRAKAPAFKGSLSVSVCVCICVSV